MFKPNNNKLIQYVGFSAHLAAKWKLRMLVAASSQGLVYCNDYYWEEYIQSGEGSGRKKEREVILHPK